MRKTPTTLRRTLCAATAAGAVATGVGGIALTTSGAAAARSDRSASSDCLAAKTCLTPQQLRDAYGVTPLTRHGIDGRGQTVVLPEAAVTKPDEKTTELRPELARFAKRFHLPATRLQFVRTVANARPALATPEEALDVEVVHAIAPRAAIRVVLAKGPAAGIPAAVRASGTTGSVVSVSGGISERCVPADLRSATDAALRAAQQRRLTVVAAGGDNGAVANPCGGRYATQPTLGFPSSDPLALSVGGTQLSVGSNGAYGSESVWNSNAKGASGGEHLGAGGGGFSSLYPRPDYQSGVSDNTMRATPDVAADAAPKTGMAHVTVGRDGAKLTAAAGTSASAPLWAAIVALADQQAGRHLGFVNPAIYAIGRSASAQSAFHDVTSGDNTVKLPSGQTVTGYAAKPGWDPVTGWGSPNAAVLVGLLAKGA